MRAMSRTRPSESFFSMLVSTAEAEVSWNEPRAWQAAARTPASVSCAATAATAATLTLACRPSSAYTAARRTSALLSVVRAATLETPEKTLILTADPRTASLTVESESPRWPAPGRRCRRRSGGRGPRRRRRAPRRRCRPRGPWRGWGCRRRGRTPRARWPRRRGGSGSCRSGGSGRSAGRPRRGRRRRRCAPPLPPGGDLAVLGVRAVEQGRHDRDAVEALDRLAVLEHLPDERGGPADGGALDGVGRREELGLVRRDRAVDAREAGAGGRHLPRRRARVAGRHRGRAHQATTVAARLATTLEN